jgi:hypothetical protein
MTLGIPNFPKMEVSMLKRGIVLLVITTFIGCNTMEGHMATGTLIDAATGNPTAGATVGFATGFAGRTIAGMNQENFNRQYANNQQQLALSPPPAPSGARNNRPFFDYDNALWKCFEDQGHLLVWQQVWYRQAYAWLWR